MVNVGPLKYFTSGLRLNVDLNATGVAKQSNYELVGCSGHGKNGSLCVLQQSICPELITEVELAGCKGMWTVYYKGSSSHASESAKLMIQSTFYAPAHCIIFKDTIGQVQRCAYI